MTTVMKLNGLLNSTNTARVLTVLHEKDVEFVFSPVDARNGAHKHPSFLALNPFGHFPVLEDGDLTLFESRAIGKYLASKYKDEEGADLLRLGSLAEWALVDVWLEVESKKFDPAIEPLVFELVIKPALGRGATDAAVVDAQAEKLGKVLDVYEERLGKNRYLAGEHYTLADLHHLPFLFYLMKTPKAELVTSRPHVLAWWQDISARPAWLKTAAGMKFP